MDHKTYMLLQIEEIKKHVWIESEKNKRDMAGEAEVDWITKYAKEFRRFIEREYGPIE